MNPMGIYHGDGLILSCNHVHHKRKGTMWFVVVLASYLFKMVTGPSSWFEMPSIFETVIGHGAILDRDSDIMKW